MDILLPRKLIERFHLLCCTNRRYPLMASASDDGSVHVFHCMVYR
jgi:hypothetical protein